MQTAMALLLVLAGAGAGVIVALVIARAREQAAVATATAPLRTAEATARTELDAARRWCESLERKSSETEAELARCRGQLEAARSEIAALNADRATFDARLEELGRAHTELQTTFKALSADALRQNNEAFLQLARTELEKATASATTDLEKRQVAIQELLTPIREGLTKYDDKIGEIERARAESFGSLGQKLEQVLAANDTLKGETQRLVQALRAPRVRGRWGEIQLERVVELAGMLDHCDFRKQESVDTETGRLRPDMTIQLPNGKTIVVDAKTPLEAYIAALDAPNDEQRHELLVRHAQQVRTHIDQLSKKTYWEQFGEASPEFVVMFIPGEAFFSAALEHDPALIDVGAQQRVILATPTTLIALLKAVAFGWRQERVTREAIQIAALGKELYERIATLGGHVSDVGKGLDKAVGAFNKAAGSLESRVLVTARKFAEFDVSSVEALEEVGQVEAVTRQLQAPELTPTRALPPIPPEPS